jgi:sialate O-acetylesterase
LFSDHAVLQRERDVPIWGWADPGEKVKVTLPNQEHTAEADGTGRWQVTLTPLAAGGAMTIVFQGNNRLAINDVQVGDVWLCSGQSNMTWTVADSRDADIEIPAANYEHIRLINVATEGSQTPTIDFAGHWDLCTSKTVPQFSAVAYYFGRDMLQNVKVPIGLIHNSWGGSACEAWIRRDLLEGNPLYDSLLKKSDEAIAGFNEKKARAEFNRKLSAWEAKAAAAKRGGAPAPPGKPGWISPLTDQFRPGNLYNGRIKPIMPYAIRGVIWYQGESNAKRAYQYREMFPLLIKNWRDDWGQGDFPFYWVQLADYMAEQNRPGDSAWAELRHTGQAVAIDLGETNNIHPKNKQDVGRRLARLALAKTFGRKIAHDSPRYKSMYKQGDTILIRFRGVDGRLQTVDDKPITGFAIAAADRKWQWADAKIVGTGEVEVHSDAVHDPFAVRYAWADNPVCNLIDSARLPATPFRTDTWPGVTDDAR